MAILTAAYKPSAPLVSDPASPAPSVIGLKSGSNTHLWGSLGFKEKTCVKPWLGGSAQPSINCSSSVPSTVPPSVFILSPSLDWEHLEGSNIY